MQLILHHPALIVPAGRGRAAPCCSRHASNLSFTKRSVKPGIRRYTSMFSPKHHAWRRSRNAARYPPASSTHSLPADGPSCRHNLPKVDMCPRVCSPASRETSVTVSFHWRSTSSKYTTCMPLPLFGGTPDCLPRNKLFPQRPLRRLSFGPCRANRRPQATRPSPTCNVHHAQVLKLG